MSTLDGLAEVEQALGPLGRWAYRCHEACLYLVKSGVLPPGARVVRGVCKGVGAQHSWVSLGPLLKTDTYRIAWGIALIDPTLWSYRTGIWTGTLQPNGWHRPHGAGSIWEWGRPSHHGGDTISIDTTDLSPSARTFLDLIEPLDLKGWSALLHAPVEGWPATEILTAVSHHPLLAPHVPIDVVGNYTDRNPQELYW